MKKLWVDLRLRWAHRSFCWFCHVVAHLSLWRNKQKSPEIIPVTLFLEYQIFFPITNPILHTLYPTCWIDKKLISTRQSSGCIGGHVTLSLRHWELT